MTAKLDLLVLAKRDSWDQSASRLTGKVSAFYLIVLASNFINPTVPVRLMLL
jgi:hypothetical protein